MYTPAELRRAEQISAEPAQKIYTTHAGGKDVLRLPKFLDELDAVLIDIRFAPPIHPLGWNRDYLKLLLKGRYRHLPTLGARELGGGKSAIQNLGLGIKIITELKINVLLFCSCQDEKNCHRHLIAKELKRQGREAVEVSRWE